MRVALCESCGAPLGGTWTEIVVVCAYCGAHNAPGRPGEPVPPSIPDDGRPRLNVAGRTYVIVGRLATGETTDVFEGRWALRLGERVVVKVLRDPRDEDLLRREAEVLRRLHAADAPGAVQLVRRLPQPVALGPARIGHRERLVSVHRWRAGFTRTMAELPGDLDPRAGVWLLKRLLEILGWMHRAGFVHGAVIPPHVLVHRRDHGALLVGFATATAAGEPLPAAAAAWRSSYRRAPGEIVRPADDVAMAAAGVLALTGSLPEGLATLIGRAAEGAETDAWALRDRLDAEALRALGPPSYTPIP
jgi:hypothetical protein